MTVRILFSPEERQYTGRELCSHFAYRTWDLPGDSVVAFTGMCWVEPEALVDLADRKAGASIFSRRMLHFIIEHFDRDLRLAVWRQRLFAAIVQQELQQRGVAHVVRRGDDLFVGEAKLSVSVATASPVSTLVHFGINIDAQGAPVPALGLGDFRIDPRTFALAVMEAYRQEWLGIEDARTKVRAVP
ncbi:MAG: hypothetical protein KatS3mg102_2552 [Planctomycetota bacterium]|nr:MAG: hypothetical protein KatS3mg102_2552 [Planctomycetota bacterium]